ncbi:MAG TPA: carotenoid biosynthesis protein [Candidatus Dojkabacteria bacterium]|nr:carotenoid biosynthesis protein [Candidatus Dojkabacteria bacterium]
MGRKKKQETQATPKKTNVKTSFDLSILVILTYIALSLGFLFKPTSITLVTLLPWVMLLTSAFVVYKIKPNTFLLSIFFLVISLTFVIEAIGVLTGIPFGDFFFLNHLGYKVVDVPIIIAINWSMLIFSAYVFSQQLIDNLNIDKRFVLLLTSIIVTLIDYIMEPVAVYLRLWNWSSGIIPTTNYLSWFIFTLLCTTFIYFITWGKKINNSKYILAFLIGQTIFFTIINILIIA